MKDADVRKVGSLPDHEGDADSEDEVEMEEGWDSVIV